jgi:hypothetical protein
MKMKNFPFPIRHRHSVSSKRHKGKKSGIEVYRYERSREQFFHLSPRERGRLRDGARVKLSSEIA